MSSENVAGVPVTPKDSPLVLSSSSSIQRSKHRRAISVNHKTTPVTDSIYFQDYEQLVDRREALEKQHQALVSEQHQLDAHYQHEHSQSQVLQKQLAQAQARITYRSLAPRNHTSRPNAPHLRSGWDYEARILDVKVQNQALRSTIVTLTQQYHVAQKRIQATTGLSSPKAKPVRMSPLASQLAQLRVEKQDLESALLPETKKTLLVKSKEELEVIHELEASRRVLAELRKSRQHWKRLLEKEQAKMKPLEEQLEERMGGHGSEERREIELHATFHRYVMSSGEKTQTSHVSMSDGMQALMECYAKYRRKDGKKGPVFLTEAKEAQLDTHLRNYFQTRGIVDSMTWEDFQVAFEAM